MKEKKENKTLSIVLSVVVFSLMALYVYKEYAKDYSIYDEDVLVIEREIKSYTEDYDEDAEENYMEFKFNGSNQKYFIGTCAYNIVDKEALEQVNVGDTLQIQVFLDAANDDEIDILQLESKSKVLLAREQYVGCLENQWKEFPTIIGILVFLSLIGKLLSIIGRYLKKVFKINSNHTDV